MEIVSGRAAQGHAAVVQAVQVPGGDHLPHGWLYHRLPRSFREIEELLLARGIIVPHETICQWCDRFGPEYAASLRRRRPQASAKWHLDEVFIKINGVPQYWWRAVDEDGHVLDILVQSKPDTNAAKRFMGLDPGIWTPETLGS
ncbi:transposase [Streptomyces sp. NPDC050658]|uniref:DDE-type integrase/transposase/recombinase n=1 Tax=unclassified Streptomyces TaxID=2593676 RepID=UPI00341D092C